MDWTERNMLSPFVLATPEDELRTVTMQKAFQSILSLFHLEVTD
jgi:hypothetical protein